MSDDGVVRDPYDSRITGRLTGPTAGPRQKRGYLELGRALGQLTEAEKAELAASEADLAARAPTAAPRVGITNTTKIDPKILAALLRAAGK